MMEHSPDINDSHHKSGHFDSAVSDRQVWAHSALQDQQKCINKISKVK